MIRSVDLSVWVGSKVLISFISEGTQASRSGGASAQCTHFKVREKLVGVSCVVSSRRFCVSMVSARGIVPCFGEKLAYIKQRSSFGLGIILVEYILVRSSPDL